ncbi:hypothetical protein DOY81_008438 [Sarcophaga bullata]|nr:hypothetical protein DOY81_008438 [Sarcophaga bullata]
MNKQHTHKYVCMFYIKTKIKTDGKHKMKEKEKEKEKEKKIFLID